MGVDSTVLWSDEAMARVDETKVFLRQQWTEKK
jgi:hypothetical protein